MVFVSFYPIIGCLSLVSYKYSIIEIRAYGSPSFSLSSYLRISSELSDRFHPSSRTRGITQVCHCRSFRQLILMTETAIAPDLSLAYRQGFRPPHITIQMPVYKESLQTVLKPTIESLRAAISHYELNGGSASIFVNDDGIQPFLHNNKENESEKEADKMLAQ
jgi:hypothetical protein